MRYDQHDHSRTDRWVQLVLRWGMVASMVVLLIGLLLFALGPEGYGEVDMGFGDIARGLIAGNPIAVIDLGIILLIATPLTRVLTTLAIFIADREPRFILASLLVLGIIATAILLG